MKGCYTCKNDRKDADEEPCLKCKFSGQAPEGEDNWEPKEPPTNAERIRMMSDEELAEVICPMEFENGYRGTEVQSCAGENCTKCCLEWLQKREGAE